MASVRGVAPWAVVTSIGAVLSGGGLAQGQLVVNGVERNLSTVSDLSNGQSDSDGDGSSVAGAFDRSLATLLAGPGSASADSFATQQSFVGAGSAWGSLSAANNVKTGTTFITGQGQGMSNFLLLFSLAAPTPVSFNASGSISLTGRNPEGEPSDLYGRAYVRLVDASTEDLIAGFTLFPFDSSDSATFNGVLPAGNYALLAQAFSFGFSADLLGPPARSGAGSSQVQFNLAVPTPASAALLGMGGAGLIVVRRRRR